MQIVDIKTILSFYKLTRVRQGFLMSVNQIIIKEWQYLTMVYDGFIVYCKRINRRELQDALPDYNHQLVNREIFFAFSPKYVLSI